VRRFLIIAGSGYVLMAIALVTGLTIARNAAAKSFGSEAAKRDWEEWRQDTATQQKSQQPVERSVPRSEEPPTLVLLRDHFGTCLVTSFMLTSVLYWTTALFVRGILFGPSFPVEYGDPK
jgi:hypothetical protein